jgi:hypothetical protein
MADCIYCTVPDLLSKKLPILLIGIPVPDISRYLNYTQIHHTEITSFSDFQKNPIFTPGSRLDMSLDSANQLIAHRKAWLETLKMSADYFAVFDDPSYLNNVDLSIRLENLKLPKDWDVIIITESQYVFTKRSAKIFIDSTLQFHLPLKTFLKSFKILKVLDINTVS